MIILFLLIPLMCFIKLKPAKPLFNGFNDNYISLRSTQCINGIFILLVFLSHARNRILTLPSYTSDPLNSIYGIIQDHLGQSIVITFLFFSGFGVMESIKKKGAQYVSAMPSRRIGKTLLHFDMYRLSGAEELWDIGWDDYLDRGAVCAVEWSENVSDAFTGREISVRIEKLSPEERRISIEGGGF